MAKITKKFDLKRKNGDLNVEASWDQTVDTSQGFPIRMVKDLEYKVFKNGVHVATSSLGKTLREKIQEAVEKLADEA